MKHVNVKGMDMSVFTLGTVQLGMDYGLGEHTQQPPKEAAFALLDRAVACGVNTFDTANNYGDSEKTIGEWLQTKQPKERPYVVTKIGPFDR
ncbi:MAG: aldo/keto reductase, partial [Eubacteriales bacterium]|nr:aldo/keto reductase [Eubacteriales bacterium]